MPARTTQPHRLRIGTAPVNWNNNDLAGWRPLVPFPRILDEMRDAGYVATEWDASFGSDVEDLKRECAARSMSFTGAYRWLDFVDDGAFQRDLAAVEPSLATLQAIGAEHLIVADTLRPHRVAMAGSVPEDGSASLTDADYARLGANLARLANVASAFGLNPHYHNHVGSYIETPTELATLLPLLADAGVDLCFDTGHYAFGGGDSLAFLQEHHRSIGYLHLKDVDPVVLAMARSHRWSFLDSLRSYVFSPIGAGNARIAEVIDLLMTIEFQHYVTIEQDTCRDDSTTNARANLEQVRTFEHASRSTQRTTPCP